MRSKEIENAYGRISNLQSKSEITAASIKFIRALGATHISQSTGLTLQAVQGWVYKGIPAGWGAYFALKYPQIWSEYFFPLKTGEVSND